MCDVVDGGTQWQFVDGQPFPDFEPFCPSKCVDFPGTLTLVGQRDLRKVPLLPKLRKVDRLIINVVGLPDLRGLERVDIGTLLNIVNIRSGAPDQTFTSTIGLEDDAIDVVSVSDTPGLRIVERFPRRVTSLSFEETGLTELDLSAATTSHLGLIGNAELRTLTLGSEPMETIWIDSNKSLQTVNANNLRVRKSIRISRNPQLSSCRAEELTRDAGAPLVTVIDNGPCP